MENSIFDPKNSLIKILWNQYAGLRFYVCWNLASVYGESEFTVYLHVQFVLFHVPKKLDSPEVYLIFWLNTRILVYFRTAYNAISYTHS